MRHSPKLLHIHYNILFDSFIETKLICTKAWNPWLSFNKISIRMRSAIIWWAATLEEGQYRDGNFASSTSNFNQQLQESWSSCNLGYAVAAELRLCLNGFAFTLPAYFILYWRNTRSFRRKTTPWHCFWKTTTKPNPLIPLEKAILNGKQSYAHFHTHMADSDLSYASTNWNAHYNMVKFAGDLAQIL